MEINNKSLVETVLRKEIEYLRHEIEFLKKQKGSSLLQRVFEETEFSTVVHHPIQDRFVMSLIARTHFEFDMKQAVYKVGVVSHSDSIPQYAVYVSDLDIGKNNGINIATELLKNAFYHLGRFVEK